MNGAIPIVLLVIVVVWLVWDGRSTRRGQAEINAGWDAIHARAEQPCPDCPHPRGRHWHGCGDCDCQAERRTLFDGCI